MLPPVPVILDTDPGVDDALALLLAGVSPEVEVLAVTVVGGNVPVDRCLDNARRVLPIAWGDHPLPALYGGASADGATAEHVHGADGLGGCTRLRGPDGRALYPPLAPVTGTDAPGAILAVADARPGEGVLVTLGPLTNAAEAARRAPDRFRKLRRIVVMGGAIREPGNVTPTAEFNVFADPEAAQAVCGAGVPLTWIPLDATHRCLLRPGHLDALPNLPRTRLVRAMLPFAMAHHALGYGEPGCFLHDPVALGAVLWPDLYRLVSLCLDVETRGTLTRGMTVADLRPPAYRSPLCPNAEVCLEFDAPRFLARFLARLGAS